MQFRDTIMNWARTPALLLGFESFSAVHIGGVCVAASLYRLRVQV